MSDDILLCAKIFRLANSYSELREHGLYPVTCDRVSEEWSTDDIVFSNDGGIFGAFGRVLRSQAAKLSRTRAE